MQAVSVCAASRATLSSTVFDPDGATVLNSNALAPGGVQQRAQRVDASQCQLWLGGRRWGSSRKAAAGGGRRRRVGLGQWDYRVFEP